MGAMPFIGTVELERLMHQFKNYALDTTQSMATRRENAAKAQMYAAELTARYTAHLAN